MKKLILAGLILSLLAPTLEARRKKPKAGKVKDWVYTDKQYNFRMKLREDWKYSIGNADDNFRLVLTQRKYETPPNYMDASEYTKVPRIVVFADTCTMSAMQILDSLLSETYSSDQKKEILKEFEILGEASIEEGEREETVTRKRTILTVGGEAGATWEGKADYRKYVSTSATAIGGTRVSGAYGGGVVVGKKDNAAVLFHVMSEWEYFANIMDVALSMIATLEWVAPEKTETKEKKGS